MHDHRRRDRTVLVTTIERPAGATGVHTHMAEFLQWARARDVPVRLVSPWHANAALRYPLFGVGRLAKPVSTGFWVWWYRSTRALVIKQQLRRELDACGPAVVYAQDPISALAAIELREAGAPIEVVLIVHFNGSQAEEFATMGLIARGGRLYQAIERVEREAFSASDRLIFPSSYAARAAGVTLDGELPRGRWVIPNFVSRRASASREPIMRGDLITIGSLEPRKNQQFLLRVLAEAHRRGRRYTLTIVGSGPLASRLRWMTTSFGLDGFVTLTGARPDAADLLAHHRVYVHAALMENCPMVLLEAMAAGLPLLAPAVGGIPEMFSDGVEGFFWNLEDVSAAADHLMRVLDDEPRRDAMASAARGRYDREFSPDARCPMLLRALL